MWAPLLPPQPLASVLPCRSRRVVCAASSRLAPSPLSAQRLLVEEGVQGSQVDSAQPAEVKGPKKRVSRRGAANRQQQRQPEEQTTRDGLDDGLVLLPLQPVNALTPQQTAQAQQEQIANNKLLEDRMTAATSRQEAFMYALHGHPTPLQPPQLVLVCSHLARMCDPATMTYRGWKEMQEAVGQLLEKYPSHVEKMSSYELVVLLSSLARVRYTPSTEWLDRYFVASLPHLSSYGPGYIYLQLRSLTRMGMLLWELKEAPTFRDWMHKLLDVAKAKVWSYRGDELIRTLAVIGQLNWRPPAAWLVEWSKAIKSRLEFLDPPLLSKALISLGAQHSKPDAGLIEALFTQLSTKLPMFDDRDLASAAQAVGLVKRVMKGEFFSEFMVEVARKADSFSPASLAFLLHALGEGVSNGGVAVLAPHHHAAAAAVAPSRRTSSPSSSQPFAAADSQPHSTTAAPAAAQDDRYLLLDEYDGDVSASNNGNGNGHRHGVQQAAYEELPDLALEPIEHMTAVTAQSGRLLSPGPVARVKRRLPILLDSGPDGGTLPGSGWAGEASLMATAALPELVPRAPRSPFPRRTLPLPVANLNDLRPIYPDISESPRGPASRNAGHTDTPAFTHPHRPGRWRVLPAASPAWLQVMAGRVYESLPAMNTYLSSMALRGLTNLGYQLDAHQLDAFFQHSKPELKNAKAEEFVNFVQALAASGYKPRTPESARYFQEWYLELCRIAARRIYTPSQVCDMVSGLAALPIAPPEELLNVILTYTRRNRPSALRHTSPRRVARLITALRTLRYRPDFGFCHSFAQAVRIHYTNFEAQELTAVLCGIAAAAPSPLAVDALWMSEMLLLVQCRLDRFNAVSLAALLGGVVALSSDPRRCGPTNCGAPSEVWCTAVFARLEEQSRGMSAPHAASILWSAACILQQRMRKHSPSGEPLDQPLQHEQQQQTSNQPAVEGNEAVTCGASPAFLQSLTACVAEGVDQLSDAQVMDVAGAIQLLGLTMPPRLALREAERQAVAQRQQEALEQHQRMQEQQAAAAVAQQQAVAAAAAAERRVDSQQRATFRTKPARAQKALVGRKQQAKEQAKQAKDQAKQRQVQQDAHHIPPQGERRRLWEAAPANGVDHAHVQGANGTAGSAAGEPLMHSIAPVASNGVHVLAPPVGVMRHEETPLTLRAGVGLTDGADLALGGSGPGPRGAVLLVGDRESESGWTVATQVQASRGRHAASLGVPA